VVLALVPLLASAQPEFADYASLARIITGQADPQQCLSAVFIREIDGEELTTRTQDFQLQPGWHSMNGMAVIDTQQCPVAIGGAPRPVPALEYQFDAGMTYYVGLDHGSENPGDWRLVIWKVEGPGVSAAND
jgi:hypothetical protein